MLNLLTSSLIFWAFVPTRYAVLNNASFSCNFIIADLGVMLVLPVCLTSLLQASKRSVLIVIFSAYNSSWLQENKQFTLLVCLWIVKRLVVTSVSVIFLAPGSPIKLIDLCVKCFYAAYDFEYKNYFPHNFKKSALKYTDFSKVCKAFH